jgi:hypothetical protein
VRVSAAVDERTSLEKSTVNARTISDGRPDPPSGIDGARVRNGCPAATALQQAEPAGVQLDCFGDFGCHRDQVVADMKNANARSG